MKSRWQSKPPNSGAHSEFYKYAEIGWTPEKSKRFLTNVHLGMFHTDARQQVGVPETYGATLSANHTFDNQLMIFGRLGWSNGGGALARRAVNAGLMWRPGTYDDLLGIAATVADLTTPGLPNQTTLEAFYRLDLARQSGADGRRAIPEKSRIKLERPAGLGTETEGQSLMNAG
ncbi:hypothetical protein [Ruegeria atlantica]|uniref:Uncharacterized protein n=1 Tax=Ruegeria atlantica TaxID=81569 RepID=A0A0P1F5T7_9RHOB|nr:hypothetical protein [Ruegeria atlantica]CUH48717.1 hypothetical protein RUA4292_02906 [Ruegeria atlantica]